VGDNLIVLCFKLSQLVLPWPRISLQNTFEMVGQMCSGSGKTRCSMLLDPPHEAAAASTATTSKAKTGYAWQAPRGKLALC